MSIEEKMEALSAAQAECADTKAKERLKKLFDDGVFTEIDVFARSGEDYAEAAAAHGTVDGLGVYAYAQNSAAGGAMSKAQAAKILKLYDLALKTGEPVVALLDSAGGRLQQGTELLAAYGEILQYANRLSGVVPQIAVVLGKCLGTQALIAAGADLLIMSKEGSLSLKTNGADASSEANAKRGLLHLLAENEDEAIRQTRTLLAMLPSNNLATACVAYDSISPAAKTTPEMTPSQAAFAVVDEGSLVELQSGCAEAAKIALATVNGTTVGLVAFEGAELDGKACAKAARFVRFCDAFSLPVITFTDAGEFGCLKGAAKLTSAYAEATTAKINIITGDAFGAVYIALAGTGAAADMTYAWPNACVSALTPEAAAVVLLGDDYGGRLKGTKDPAQARADVVRDFKESELTAMKAAENGYVDDIIPAEATRAKLVACLEMLCNKRVSTLPKKHNNLAL